MVKRRHGTDLAGVTDAARLVFMLTSYEPPPVVSLTSEGVGADQVARMAEAVAVDVAAATRRHSQRSRSR